MADVAKYGEIKVVSNSFHLNETENFINRFLADGWELITVKVVEAQFKTGGTTVDHYIQKAANLTIVLGKPRKKQ